MTLLEVDGLAVRSAERVIAGPVSFMVETGRPLTILGETGAGKSLIAQAILGMLPRGLVASGRIALDGERIDALAPRARARLWGRRIALLPQEPWRALDPTMGALEQVEEGHRLVAGLDVDPARDAAAAAFGRLGLAGAERRLPGALSGGMAQRVAFAAATAGGARLLLVDEPTKGLDAAARDSVIALLSSAMAAGAALLTITHDVALARALGGDAMILREGRVLESGSMEETLSRPRSPYGRELVAADPAMWPVRERRSGGAVALRGENLTVARGGRRLVERLDISLCAGERVAVTGPSGSGKSSLIDVLAGLLPPVEGRVIRSQRVGPLGVQKLYQDPPAAFAARVSVGRSLRDLAGRHGLPFGGLLALLDRLAVPHDLLDRRPDAVSGGELQRLALARVLALRPAVILADEPTSRLDPVTQRRVMAVIGDAAAETDAAVALVTHNDEIARRWADRVVAVGENAARARDRHVA